MFSKKYDETIYEELSSFKFKYDKNFKRDYKNDDLYKTFYGKESVDFIMKNNPTPHNILKFLRNSNIYKIKFKKEEEEIIINLFTKSANDTSFLKFDDYYDKLKTEIGIYFYEKYENQIGAEITLIIISIYLINHVNENFKQKICNKLILLSRRPYSDQIRQNAIDVLLHIPEYTLVGEELLNVLRRDQTIDQRVDNKNVYTDTQNVHNKTINENILESANKLIESEIKDLSIITSFDFDEVEKELIQLFPRDRQTIELVLNRVQVDTSVYKNNITLKLVFISLITFIEKSSNKIDLYHRLVEECRDMVGTCGTGHLSRLVNVLNGMNDNIKIGISMNDEIQGIIYNYLNKIIMNENDMFDFSDFDRINKLLIKNSIHSFFKKLEEEYKREDIIDISYELLAKYFAKDKDFFKNLKYI